MEIVFQLRIRVVGIARLPLFGRPERECREIAHCRVVLGFQPHRRKVGARFGRCVQIKTSCHDLVDGRGFCGGSENGRAVGKRADVVAVLDRVGLAVLLVGLVSDDTACLAPRCRDRTGIVAILDVDLQTA